MCVIDPDDRWYRRLQVQEMEMTFRHLLAPTPTHGIVIVELLARADTLAPLYDVFQLAARLPPGKQPVFVIGINASTASGKQFQATLPTLRGKVVNQLRTLGLAGGCVSFTFNPTTNQTSVGAYPFPYFEARALLSLHPGATVLRERLAGWDAIFVRTMDVDGSNDPLLTKGIKPQVWASLRETGCAVMTGAYQWNTNNVQESVVDLTAIPLTQCLTALNTSELAVRAALFKTLGAAAIYWPEPNLYSEVSCHDEGARAMADHATTLGNEKGQITESKFIVRAALKQELKFRFDAQLAVEKPIKDGYLRDFFYGLVHAHDQLLAGEDEPTIRADLGIALKSVRQTHLDRGNVEKIMGWHEAASYGLESTIDEIVGEQRTACAGVLLELLKAHIGPETLELAKIAKTKSRRKKEVLGKPKETSETMFPKITLVETTEPEETKKTGPHVPKQKDMVIFSDTTDAPVSNRKIQKKLKKLSTDTPSTDKQSSNEPQMPVCVNAPNCTAGPVPAPRKFAWVFWNWHHCTRCGVYYCPNCGDGLPTVSILTRVRRCTTGNCGGTTELY